jgi:hypothetical protein
MGKEDLLRDVAQHTYNGGSRSVPTAILKAQWRHATPSNSSPSNVADNCGSPRIQTLDQPLTRLCRESVGLGASDGSALATIAHLAVELDVARGIRASPDRDNVCDHSSPAHRQKQLFVSRDRSARSDGSARLVFEPLRMPRPRIAAGTRAPLSHVGSYAM